MYERTLAQTWERFAAHLDGARAALVCVLSAQPLGDAAKAALASSASALGYGIDAVTFASLATKEKPEAKTRAEDNSEKDTSRGQSENTAKKSRFTPEAATRTASERSSSLESRSLEVGAREGTSAERSLLDERELFELVEGLDPLCVVAADARVASALARAYRQELPTMKAARLFGRPAVAFAAFESMLGDAQDKQRAWALLKTLPHLGD